MVTEGLEPNFSENYFAYTKEEFLADADMEFLQLKKYLENHPKVLKQDPSINQVYDEIRQKLIMEKTVDPFDPNEQFKSKFHDIGQIEKIEADTQRRRRYDKIDDDDDSLMDDQTRASDKFMDEVQQELIQGTRTTSSKKDLTKLTGEGKEQADGETEKAVQVDDSRNIGVYKDDKKKATIKKTKSLTAKSRLKDKGKGKQRQNK